MVRWRIAMRPSCVAVVLGIALVFTARGARADNARDCTAAAEKGQELRDAHKLLEAREQLRVCVQAVCPAFIQNDCGQWLAEVEKSLPTVVLSARDANGAYVVDVKVSVDGRLLATLLDGQAQPVNPGMHVFHFERSDGTSADSQVPVREGEKNQSIAVVLAERERERRAGALAGAATHSEPAAEGSPRVFPWTTVGWAAGALGVVGLGVGATFGLMAASDKSRADCDAGGSCDAGRLASARSHATASTIGFVGGGVLLAGGVGLVLFAPRGGPGRAGAVRAAPRVGLHATGLLIEGLW